MKLKNLYTVILFMLLFACSPLQAQDIDTQLVTLAENLAKLIKESGMKKVAVIDFTDLQDNSSELGKYIAEELTVNLVIAKKEFSVMDRANLKKILAEHKLTASGVVDPDNAKKLGEFAGLDALILGKIIPKGDKISLNAKILTTDKAELVGAARIEFKTDEQVQKLAATQVAPTEYANTTTKRTSKAEKTFGDLHIELATFGIVNDKEYFLTLNVTNRNSKKSIWIALDANSGTLGDPLKSTLSDPEGFEFESEKDDVSGISVGELTSYTGYYGGATEVTPNGSISATIKFHTRPGRRATPGTCRLQLAILTLYGDGYGKVDKAVKSNFVTEISTN